MADMRCKPIITQQGMTVTSTPRAEAYNTGQPGLSMQGIDTAQERREPGIPISNDSLFRYQNLQPGGLLTTWSTQDPQANRYPTKSYIEPRLQMQTEQNPMAMYGQYPTQNMSHNSTQIYAQQHMPAGASVQANQTIPLGLGGPYAHQSLQPMDNPKYDNMAVTPNNDNITITLDETTRPKRLRENDTHDEVKKVKQVKKVKKVKK